MDNRDILIDTTIIIEFLRKQNKQATYLWKIKEAGFNIHISTITVFELYAGALTNTHKNDLKKLFKWFEIIPFGFDTARISAEIYKNLKLKNQLIEFRDIFIAATSIEVNIPLLTVNKKHFNRIKNIKIFELEDF